MDWPSTRSTDVWGEWPTNKPLPDELPALYWGDP